MSRNLKDIELIPGIRKDWPDAIKDLNEADREATMLRFVAGIKGWDQLPEFSALRTLWAFNINQKSFENICKTKGLEELYLVTLKVASLTLLSDLPFLRILSLDSCSAISSLMELSELQFLNGLGIQDFKNINDISPLSELINLRNLKIAGGMWKPMKITSLSPLKALKNLTYLSLTNLQAKDESLQPLASLTNLKQLDIANFYPMEEFASLSGKLKNTTCTWFSPFVRSGLTCKKCEKNKMVILSGKRKGNLCEICDQERLRKHVSDFERAAG
jgi:hypothetical protein